jgi:hypothetical protein
MNRKIRVRSPAVEEPPRRAEKRNAAAHAALGVIGEQKTNMLLCHSGLLLRRDHREGRKKASPHDGCVEHLRRCREGRAGVESVMVVGLRYGRYRKTQ